MTTGFPEWFAAAKKESADSFCERHRIERKYFGADAVIIFPGDNGNCIEVRGDGTLRLCLELEEHYCNADDDDGYRRLALQLWEWECAD